MRLFALLVLALPAAADDILTTEVRAWRGKIRVEARADPGKAGSGEEVQTESVEFVAITDPRHTHGERERLQIRLRKSTGEWSLKLDLKEDQGAGDLATRGEGGGPLHFSLTGVVDVKQGFVQLKTAVKPHRLVIRASLSGVDQKGLASFRTAASRLPFLEGLDEQAPLEEDGRIARGARTFTDRHGKYPREVEITWSLERLDPAVRGRVVDQEGAAVAGAKILARTFASTGMQLREAVTGDDGRFSIPVHFASWGVQVVGTEKDGIVTSGVVRPDAAVIRFDDVPDLELEVTRYRLELLPRPELLSGHFRGDVDEYLAYIARRAPPAVLARAEVSPATRPATRRDAGSAPTGPDRREPAGSPPR